MSEADPRSDPSSQVRLSTARRLHPGAAGRPALDRLAALAARLSGVTSSQVSLVADVASAVGEFGVPPALRGDTEVLQSLCARTVNQGRPLVVNDTRSDPAVAGFPAVVSGAAGCFLGVPVLADDHSGVGALCVFEPAPRLWTQDDVATLQALAEAAAAELELAALARDFAASRTRWDLAIEASGAGSFDWDLRTGQLSWDAPLIALFGYDDDDVFTETIEAFNDRVHPADLPAVGEALQQAIDTLGDYEAQYRVVLPDGRTRQVQARGRALGTGTVAERVLGAAWDVTLTRASEDRAAALIEAMPVAYLRIGPDGVVLAANRLAEQLLRTSRPELVGRELWGAVPEAIAGRLRDLGAQAMARNDMAADELQFAGLVDAWFEVRAIPDADDLSLFFTDVTDRRKAQAAAETRAAHDRNTSTALQQALLTRLPQPDHLELHARYVPSAVADQVGGDWYDAVVQPGGAMTVVVGDVSGHDVEAAATMGQLRSILRAFIWQGDESPAAVTTALDRAIRDLYQGALATTVTARIEQDAAHRERGTHLLRWNNAGHLPPLLVDADGTVRRLLATPETMLGVKAGTVRRDHVAELASDSTLVLYTDGLVERRDADIDVGLELLTESLARHHHEPLPAMIDSVITDLVDDSGDDDVVLFAVRFHEQSPDSSPGSCPNATG